MAPGAGVSGPSTSGAPSPLPAERLAWRVHLLAENPARSAATVAILLAIGLILQLGYGTGYVVLAAALFLISLGPFFFPMYYALTPEGVTRRILCFRTTRPWSDFRRSLSDREGVRLSPFTYPSRLEPFRGLFLRFGGNRDEVLAYIARHLPEARTPSPAGGTRS